MGATNLPARQAASLGQAGPPEIVFKSSLDILNGGVLFSIPALIATGLLRHTEKLFVIPNGYYDITSIFLVLSFMALCRIKAVERLRYIPPGEWGKLVGLDRIPEAKTLREKMELLSQGETPFKSHRYPHLCEPPGTESRVGLSGFQPRWGNPTETVIDCGLR